jgi:CubicO group peptidase (beta-lactamase class C family)
MHLLRLLVLLIALVLLWTGTVGWAVLSGVGRSALAPRDDPAAFLQAAVARAEAYNRGNLALVLLEDGEVLGSHYASAAGDPVDGTTVFPTASLSKWLTAWGVMQLVQDGAIDLDAPVGRYLTRWQLPDGEHDESEVTVRRLLSHTAGLTDGLGFADYGPDETVPPLVGSLRNPRASSGEPVSIEVGAPPGEGWRYSGGGYLILELLIEEVSGEPFPAFMRRRVFEPLGLVRATYGYLGDQPTATRLYDREGEPAPAYRYAARGATGLAASADDLVRFAQAQVGDAPGVETAAAMREPVGSSMGAPIWGLGTMLYAPTEDGDFVFGHDGANEPAINSAVRIHPETGDAIVVLVTGGPGLASDLGFEWVFWQTGVPDFLQAPRLIEAALPLWFTGVLALVLLVLGGAWWRRRRAA